MKIKLDARPGFVYLLPMPATRTALLTVTFPRTTARAAFAADDVATACTLARKLADAGHAVTLNWSADEIDDRGEGAVLRAMAAVAGDTRFPGKVVAYRLLRNSDGEVVVWLQVSPPDAPAGRGYLLGYYPPADRLTIVSAAPTSGLYMWGQARLRAHEPVEGAVIVQDWRSLA